MADPPSARLHRLGRTLDRSYDLGVTARVASGRLIGSIELCLTAMLSLIACARSPRKQPTAELTQPPWPSTDAKVQLAMPNGSTASRTARARPSGQQEHSCIENLDPNLEGDAWYTAASQACHPGSTRATGIISLPLNSPGPVTLEIPAALQSSCWTAFASVDERQLPIAVEIADMDGISQSLGALVSPHSMIPALGPLCSIRTRFHHLAILPAKVVDGGTLSIVFYSRQAQSQ
jgi:hypothetical protein